MEPKSNVYLVVAVFWTFIITYLSLATVDGISSRFPLPHKDKIVHFVFYFGFVYWWSKGISVSQITKRRIVLFSAIGYGVLMEFLQRVLTENRAADFWDAVANTLGALSAYFWITNKNK